MKFLSFFLFAALSLLSFSSFAQTEDPDSLYLDSIGYEDYTFEGDSIIAYQAVDEDSGFPMDTVNIQPRSYSESKLNELREDEDYNYAEAPTVGESLLERLWRWLIEFIANIFAKMATTDWGNVLTYLLAVAALIIIVMMVLKVDAFRVLTKSGSGVTKGVFHENIHEMDFDQLIQEAIGKRDFRNAVRLVFLQSLKLLSDKQHIDWQPGKTNHDYLDEVQAIDVKKGLGQLSYYFDYAWYGGFPISETQFSRVRTIFDSWRGAIK